MTETKSAMTVLRSIQAQTQRLFEALEARTIMRNLVRRLQRMQEPMSNNPAHIKEDFQVGAHISKVKMKGVPARMLTISFILPHVPQDGVDHQINDQNFARGAEDYVAHNMHAILSHCGWHALRKADDVIKECETCLEQASEYIEKDD